MSSAILIYISDYSTKNCNINIVTIKVIYLLVIRALIKINYQNKLEIHFEKRRHIFKNMEEIKHIFIKISILLMRDVDAGGEGGLSLLCTSSMQWACKYL